MSRGWRHSGGTDSDGSIGFTSDAGIGYEGGSVTSDWGWADWGRGGTYMEDICSYCGNEGIVRDARGCCPGCGAPLRRGEE